MKEKKTAARRLLLSGKKSLNGFISAILAERLTAFSASHPIKIDVSFPVSGKTSFVLYQKPVSLQFVNPGPL